MYNEWLAMQHYRIHVMEQWPDGPRKRAGLAAARSVIERLDDTLFEESSFACATCAAVAADIERAAKNRHAPGSLSL